jgi:mandelate racemase
VIRAIRRAVGDGVAVMVDYNQSLTPPEAIERLRRLEGEGLAWVEEPVLANDFQGHAAVASAIRTPIQCGENWWGPMELRHAVEAHASDYVMLDAMKIGGVTGWMRGASMAAAQGLPVSSHLWTELSTQLLSVSPTAHWLEYCDWWNGIIAEPIAVENGFTVPADTPGSGFDWNDAAITKLLV